MNQVPTMISTKDLSYLSDMFNWNFVLAKKIHHYISEVQEEKIKEELNNSYQLHFAILNKIITILEGGLNESSKS